MRSCRQRNRKWWLYADEYDSLRLNCAMQRSGGGAFYPGISVDSHHPLIPNVSDVSLSPSETFP
ncbi:MAG: hypothetical protein Aurels2KO_25580 [Aureliella sp.]